MQSDVVSCVICTSNNIEYLDLEKKYVEKILPRKLHCNFIHTNINNVDFCYNYNVECSYALV